MNGRRIGYALVDGERVVQLDLIEGWGKDLPKGDHQIMIELDSTFETDPETGDMKYVVNHLISKFTW